MHHPAVVRFTGALVNTLCGHEATLAEAAWIARCYLRHAERGRYRTAHLLEPSGYCTADACWHFWIQESQGIVTELCLTLNPAEAAAVAAELARWRDEGGHHAWRNI